VGDMDGTYTKNTKRAHLERQGGLESRNGLGWSRQLRSLAAEGVQASFLALLDGKGRFLEDQQKAAGAGDGLKVD
jgi:hypothetical protein